MDEKKQIEEMAKVICKSYEQKKDCETCPTEWCYAEEYATALFCNNYRKQSEVIKEFVKRFEYHLRNATFTLGQTNDIQYALKKATEETKGGAE